jgi:hypothetical protein
MNLTATSIVQDTYIVSSSEVTLTKFLMINATGVLIRIIIVCGQESVIYATPGLKFVGGNTSL